MRPRPILLAAGTALAVGILGCLLLFPFLSLLLQVRPIVLLRQLGHPLVRQALGLSLLTSTGATLLVILLGLPTAYLLATRHFPGRRAMEVLVDLPMVLPPTVAGFALLLAFGRAGLAGRTLDLLGVHLPFTTLGVVVAQAFMAAPFFIGPVRAGFRSVDSRYLDAAATLRASEAYRFFRVMLPLSLPSLATGVGLSWARALGEFGATITFAGNLPGVTQTMPLAVYLELQADFDVAVTLSIILVIMSLGLLTGLRLATSGPGIPNARR